MTGTYAAAASIVAALVLTLGLGACEALDPNPGPEIVRHSAADPDAPVPDATPATAERGRGLFADNCARCHGDSAQGTAIWPQPIQGRLGILDIVRNGRRAMPAFRTMSDSAVASIELYLSTYRIDFAAHSDHELYDIYCSGCHGDSASGSSIFAGSIQGYPDIAQIVRSGRGDMLPVRVPDSIITRIQHYLLTWTTDLGALNGREYFARVCAGCHGSAGEGTKRAYEIRNPVPGYATYVIRSGRPGRPAFRDSMPEYKESALRQSQLDEIIAWLRTASRPPTGKLLYNRFCLACHAADGSGGISQKIITGKGVDAFDEAIRAGRGGLRYSEHTKYMPSWASSEISDDEIRKMATYVRGLR